MKKRLTPFASTVAIFTATCALLIPTIPATAQNAQMMRTIAEIKSNAAANKQALSHYTWQEQQVISLKGDVKKTVSYQVSVAPDGQQQKIELGSTSAPAPTGGRIKQMIVAKKTNQFQEYGQQVATLAKQYAQPDPQLVQDAYKAGNISLQLGGAPGTTTLLIKNYLKEGDTMTLVFGGARKAIQNVQVSSYLDDPKDVVTVAILFSRLPTGLNHVASTEINGTSKQMTVSTKNFNYQKSLM